MKDEGNKVIYLVYAQEQVVGQIVLKRNWNGYAYIEDITIDRAYRCGFVIGGFDRLVYKGRDNRNDEIAIYWYLIF